MHDAVLRTLQTAGPLTTDELLAHLVHQRWVGEQHDPPIVVDVPQTKWELCQELDALGKQRFVRLGPQGWEALRTPMLARPTPQPMLF
jgi:hypothetical protein